MGSTDRKERIGDFCLIREVNWEQREGTILVSVSEMVEKSKSCFHLGQQKNNVSQIIVGSN